MLNYAKKKKKEVNKDVAILNLKLTVPNSGLMASFVF